MCPRTRRICDISMGISVFALGPYLSVKLASSIGSSSKRSGRLCLRCSLGEGSSSSSSIFLLKTSCLSSSCDFLGSAVDAIVLARFLFGVAGDDDDGSYRVKDLVDNGDGLLLTVVIVCICLEVEHKIVTAWNRGTVQGGKYGMVKHNKWNMCSKRGYASDLRHGSMIFAAGRFLSCDLHYNAGCVYAARMAWMANDASLRRKVDVVLGYQASCLFR